jgi:hypothetical protein
MALVQGFNDTSLLLFPAPHLPAADHAFWTLAQPPPQEPSRLCC